MGDVAMTIPVLRAFQQQYPDVNLTILTRKFFRPFFRDLKRVNFIDFDPKGAHKSIFGLYRLSLAIVKTKPLAVADLHNVLRTNVIKFFSRGIYFKQIDKGRNEKKIRKNPDYCCLSESPGEGEVSTGEDHQLLVERGDLYFGHDRPRI